MVMEKCFAAVCFIPLDPNGSKFFGFSEFLAGLALMVLAWTIGDVRYHFRVQTAPIPLQRLTFSVVAIVGVLTLLTDLWRAQGWLVPKGGMLTPPLWQAFLAGIFLLTFLTWTWFAFIRRPTFGKRNAKRYAETLYRRILKGDSKELSVIADELTYSAKALVHYATERRVLRNSRRIQNDDGQPDLPVVEAYANDILLLIADKRLCRVIVESSSGTALAFFNEMGQTKKYDIQVEIFAKNIVREALLNTNSFLYHEAMGYESGLIGYHKPLSHAMFGNHMMVDTIRTLLDPDSVGRFKWTAVQWQAYCRLVLITLRDQVDNPHWNHSTALYRAKDYIENAVSGLYKLNTVANTWESDAAQCLKVVMDFIRDAVKILDKKGQPNHVRLRVRAEYGHPRESLYDDIASMIFEVIFHASSVVSPQWECWSIQHNSIWGPISRELNGPGGRVIKFKLRRLLYDEIIGMNSFPNFKGAKILGFCLNVMGLKMRDGDYDKENRPLHKSILGWTKAHYVSLHINTPRVAEACLVDGISYDVENLQLVKTYAADGLRGEASYVRLKLEPANPTRE
ncbi:ANK_REP_REGION domain-containing protein [Pseudomonas sp. IT-P395]